MRKGTISRGGRLAFVLLTALASAIFIGCGGSGGSSNGTTTGGTQLTGNQAVRAAALASVQSVSAGIGYPFQALQVAAPSGSKVPFGISSSLRSILGVAKKMRTTTKSPLGNLTYISEINLYVGDPVFGTTTATLPFFTDSAGANSAGSVVLTIPGGTTNYASYPVTVGVAININGGDLTATGNLNIVIKDATGANTITGTVTLARTAVVETLNMSLDDNFNVTGSVTIQESNATVTVTNMAGGIADTLTCNVAVAPTNLSGTGTLNLLTGVVTMNLKNASGANASATIDANGNLVINYADGSSETVTNPNNSGLTTGTGTSTSTGGTTSTATGGSTNGNALYSAPTLIVSNSSKTYGFNGIGTQVNANGDFCLFAANPSNGTPTAGLIDLAATPTAPVALNGGAVPFSINILDNIGGSFGNYWASPTATVAPFGTFASGFNQIAGPLFVSDKGIVVSGTGYFGQSQTMFGPTPDVVAFLPSVQTPQRVTVPSTAVNILLNWMAPGGGFVGTGMDSNDPAHVTVGVYWSSYQAAGTTFALPTNTIYVDAMFVNDTGQIAAYLQGGFSSSFPCAYWSSPTAQPVQLPGLGGLNDGILEVHGIAANGTIVGEDTVDGESGTKAVRWVNGQVQDLNTLIPNGTGWVLERAFGISSNGIIVGTGTFNGTESIFMLKLKP